MYYHVTTSEGVIYETDDERKARALVNSIKGATLRMGSLVGLRYKSQLWFGDNWLKGPSSIKANGVLQLAA